MTYEESVEQLESLIEAWQLDEADLNQTDINAMQTLLKENQELKKQLEEYKNPIKYFKYANKNVTEENKQLKDNWNKLRDYLHNVDVVIDYSENYDELVNIMQELEGSDE